MIDSLYREMDTEPDDWHEEPTCWVCDGYHGNRGCPIDSEPRGNWFGYDDDRY